MGLLAFILVIVSDYINKKTIIGRTLEDSYRFIVERADQFGIKISEYPDFINIKLGLTQASIIKPERLSYLNQFISCMVLAPLEIIKNFLALLAAINLLNDKTTNEESRSEVLKIYSVCLSDFPAIKNSKLINYINSLVLYVGYNDLIKRQPIDPIMINALIKNLRGRFEK